MPFFYEFGVSAGLCNFPFRYDESLIRLLYGGKAVRDGDYGFAFGQFRYGGLNEMLVFGIDACGSLVEDYHRRVFKNSARYGYTLFFAAGKSAAALAYHRG